MNTWSKTTGARTKKQVNEKKTRITSQRASCRDPTQSQNALSHDVNDQYRDFFVVVTVKKNTTKTVGLDKNYPCLSRAGMELSWWWDKNKKRFFWHSHYPSNLQPFTTGDQPSPQTASVCHVAHIYKQRGVAPQKRGRRDEVLGLGVEQSAAVSGGGPSPATFPTVQLFLVGEKHRAAPADLPLKTPLRYSPF